MNMSYTEAAKRVLIERHGWTEAEAATFAQSMIKRAANKKEKTRWLAGCPSCKTLKELQDRLCGYGENPESMKFEWPLDVWVIKKPDSTFRLQITEVHK